MMRIGLLAGGIALLGFGVWQGIMAIRKDAVADILRDLELRQIERTTQDVQEREARKEEINNATDDELLDRACRGGMLPADSCP